jgi:hypothetical protein
MTQHDLPQHILYLIKEMNDENARPEIRANYMLQLKDISNAISSEVEKFEKVYYK